jgi:predicted secreted protein
MTEAFWAYGSALQLGDGATTEVFTSIAEITKLTPPSMSRDSKDVTSQQSPDGYREFIAALRDGGEVGIEANWLPTNSTHNATTGLLETFNDNDTHNWKIILPDNLATISFAGFLIAFEPGDLTPEDEGTLTATIKVSGKPTVA